MTLFGRVIEPIWMGWKISEYFITNLFYNESFLYVENRLVNRQENYWMYTLSKDGKYPGFTVGFLKCGNDYKSEFYGSILKIWERLQT